MILAIASWAAPAPAAAARAQGGPAAAPASDQGSASTPRQVFRVSVVGVTQLPGVEVPIARVPAPVQRSSAEEIERSGALDLAAFLARRANGVFVNEIQNNPFQPDVNYRGYTASPLLGTPQGMSVYMDGVRLNQPFGETVSWDLIPRNAISTTTLMPGSNPLFGLNTLGGAIALETKSGLTDAGTTVQATYGSDVRRALEVEHGGHTASSTFHWYLAGTLFAEDGWRDDSPSDVRQLFGKVGWSRDDRSVDVSVAHADNSLNGNGLQDFRMLEADRSSVYTKPDTTDNRSTLVSATSRFRLDERTVLQADVFVRNIHTGTFNGDINEEALDQSLYQPGAAERAALAAAGYGTIPDSGLNADNTPFPSLRCIGNVLLQDEPAEKCNGLINRSTTKQRSAGSFAQVTRRTPVGAGENLLVGGGGFEHSRMDFVQSTELGYLNPDRSITGLGVFGDGVSGGTIDGEPFDTRVDLDGSVTTWSLFVADTLSIGERVHLSLSGRYNRAHIRNRDQLQPGGGPGSLDGNHVFGRFNPAAGVAVDLPGRARAYAGYSEGSRVPTSIELGCADPGQPCKLPNAMAGDPPLEQVVTRTYEAGVQQSAGRFHWNAGVFTARNDDDILFVTAEQTGYGYFRNFGRTRRAGLELGARVEAGRVTAGTGYTLLSATFESEEMVNGEGNSTNDAALDGEPGQEGSIAIAPGDRIPLMPRHQFKAFADVAVTSRLSVDVGLVAMSGSYARGNENNAHEPDGTYYLGPGFTDPYAVVNLTSRYALTRSLQLVAQIDNLFDQDYATASQLGPAGFTPSGRFVARPLPPEDGEYPLRHTTFVAPGAPRRGWVGLRVRF
jgi:outer membrane receptor protein involved in Fe transport